MDDMKVIFVFIRFMLADESYVPVNESYHYKMAFVYVFESVDTITSTLLQSVSWVFTPLFRQSKFSRE